ncbi:hypothetical protein CYFUS_009168 [Cystobacter fuscus]|uniref:Protein kinase domain-containing protein n=1 Tax=Cystobacter fuscus TaxID=43 RepID=A0A250JJ87_9BACT|nr:zinc ribbon domain-containing protein [Cystobacter fuscus]ATB43688.1 hypothetical protein CYFUS_009168 [Cystobacter fuscus]
MAERVVKCPQCNAPLAPGRFARSTVCGYCGTTVQIDPSAVSVARYRQALQEWEDPARHGYSQWWTVGTGHWAPGPLIARGEISDVYAAERARRPTERILMKVLRDPEHAPLLEHEWRMLVELQAAIGNEAPAFLTHLPQPVAHGTLRGGPYEGRQALLVRQTPGYLHTFEAVRRVHASGVDPRVSVWMWRRILETLAVLHRAGYVHGAVLPPHLLVQHGEHGVRLVGFSCADRVKGARLRAICTRYEDFYPASLLDSQRPTPMDDVRMSARCIISVLGGDPVRATLPRSVPGALATLLERAAVGEEGEGERDLAWTLRERVGEVSAAVYGHPGFHPLVMP